MTVTSGPYYRITVPFRSVHSETDLETGVITGSYSSDLGPELRIRNTKSKSLRWDEVRTLGKGVPDL